MGNTLSTSTPTASPSSGIDRLFQTLLGFYGNKFVDLWRDMDPAEVKAVWRQELRTMTADELRRGIDGCRTRAWPPTLPEFLQLCRPPRNPHIAWMQARDGAAERDAGRIGFTDPVLFEAYRRMQADIRGGVALRGSTLDQWVAVLAIVADEAAAGRTGATEPRRIRSTDAGDPREGRRAARGGRASHTGGRRSGR